MTTKELPTVSGVEVVVCESPGGEVRVDVRLDQEAAWLTQQQMGGLFGRDRSVVTRHIRKAYSEQELDPKATRAKFARIGSEDGRTVSREADHYNLDMIISVGYRGHGLDIKATTEDSSVVRSRVRRASGGVARLRFGCRPPALSSTAMDVILRGKKCG